MSGSPGATAQAHAPSPSTSSSTSSQSPGATRHRQEDSGDQATSGMEVESSVKPTLSVPSVTPSTVAPGVQNYSQESGGTEWPTGGLGVQSEVPQGAGEGATVGAADFDGQQGALPSSSLPQTVPPSGTEVPSEGPLYPRIPDSLPPGPQDTESTPSSATWGQEGLSEQPLEGQAAEAHSLTPWDSTQVRQRCRLPSVPEYLLSPGSSGCQQQCSVMGAYHTFPTPPVHTHVPKSLFIHTGRRRKGRGVHSA